MTLTAFPPPRPASSWQPLADPALPPPLRVWTLELDAAPAQLGLLSPGELARAESFRFAIHRHRFAAGRAALRQKLGELLGLEPESLQFSCNPHGKPFLPGVEFNLAHSQNAAMLAVAPFPVGIDLEHRRAVEFDLIARQVLSPEELRLWNTLPAAGRPNAFYRVWTRKEALLKGIGCGITENTQRVSVFFENEACISARAISNRPWSIRALDLGEELSGAVAWSSLPGD